MPECGGCGSHVTENFVRVFGVEGEVQGCPDCESQGDSRGYAGLDDVGTY